MERYVAMSTTQKEGVMLADLVKLEKELGIRGELLREVYVWLHETGECERTYRDLGEMIKMQE